jgi:hypothetical protein
LIQIGFAKFRSRSEALEARDLLSGRKIDVEKGCILKAEMAKKNLHTKRGIAIDSKLPFRRKSESAWDSFSNNTDNPPLSADVQFVDESFDPFTRPSNFAHNYYMDNGESNSPVFVGSSQSSRGFCSVLYNSDSLLSNRSPIDNTQFSSIPISSPNIAGMDQNPPCNTLYVGNLPADTLEDELIALFSTCPGYRRLSFKSRNNGPMCFVEVFFSNSV